MGGDASARACAISLPPPPPHTGMLYRCVSSVFNDCIKKWHGRCKHRRVLAMTHRGDWGKVAPGEAAAVNVFLAEPSHVVESVE